jgi:hypothetical protein
MCGPEVRAIQQLEPNFRDRLASIHVEIYTDFWPDPDKRHLTDTILELRLRTELWVFVIDRVGIIRAVFEGPAATDEVGAAVEGTLSAQEGSDRRPRGY